MTRSVVMSYGDAKREYSKRRNPDTRTIGRYVITKDGDDYVFSDKERDAIIYGRLSPDNVFTFTLNLFAVDNTGFGGSNLYNMLPFVIHRLGSGKYGVTYRTTELQRYIKVRDSIIYHEGIRFCMATGKCLNPKRPYKERKDKQVNRQWLRDRKEFLAKIAVLERLGAYEGEPPEFSYIHIEDYIDVFIKCIKEKKADFKTIMSLCNSDVFCIYKKDSRAIRPNLVYRFDFNRTIHSRIKEMFSDNSLALRQAYGVFDDE